MFSVPHLPDGNYLTRNATSSEVITMTLILDEKKTQLLMNLERSDSIYNPGEIFTPLLFQCDFIVFCTNTKETYCLKSTNKNAASFHS